MLNPVELLTWLLAYTPFLQFFVIYGWFYRYEPSRLLRPPREKKGVQAWVNVFTQLGIIRETVKVHEENTAPKNAAGLLLPTVLLSLACAELLAPLLRIVIPALGRLSLPPLLLLLQFIPALYSLAYLRRRYLGPLPLRYLRSVIPLPRQSSLVRHLGDGERRT
jgi:hypothetical protein